MRRALLALVLIAAAGAAAVAGRLAVEQPPGDPARARRSGDLHLPPDGDLITGVVPRNTTLGALLAEHAIAEQDRQDLVASIEAIFDVRRVRAGQRFAIDRLHDGRVRAFEYEIDGDRRLVVHAIGALPRRDGMPGAAPVAKVVGPSFAAAIEPIEKVVTVAAVEGEINRRTPSLTQALEAVGERLDLALQMAEIFAGELDFSSDLQPGDAFRLVVERFTRDGAFVGYGAIVAAEFVASGLSKQAYRYAPASGRPGYYDAQGRSLKRFFLKSPLKFEPRITSRFSKARQHPILAYTRAHNGVDYAAPAGAPVAAVAPGLVTLAGWTSGGGRTVKVRHANGYESEYLHLSALTVRAGQRVSQGDLVGRVGATGLATGPHLHYGLRRNGAYVNPVLEHRNVPPGEPVPTVELAAFSLERDRLFALFPPERPKVAN
jgi:murein DD-endopeptidase MepM/ murein hydrolase activator NlpD